MRKLIHSRFELDLSTFKISDTEENNWYSDSFFLKYSFPFEIDLEDDLDIAFGFISLYNSENVETYFELLYVHGNTIEKAILEIESYQEKLSCTLRFGFEQLPSFDKKLSELSLDKFSLAEGTTIYEHAETIIFKSWPDSNYNFPQIHVDKYDTSDGIWENFGRILNNRTDGAFLENSVDVTLDITYNRNVMQPLPYFLHILQRGMADAGYMLSGKILTDDRISKACLYGDVDYFKTPTLQEPIDVIQMSEDASYTNGIETQNFHYNTVLASPGKYNIQGTIKSLRWSNYWCYFTIKYRDTLLFEQKSYATNWQHGTTWRDYTVDITFETIADMNPNDITIEGYVDYSEEQTIIDLSIVTLVLFDSTGTAIPTIENENKVDLTKAVADITFGDFVKVIKNWFNYDLAIENNFAIMDPIEDEINYNDAEDLQFTEIKRPLRKFSQGVSFLLKFQDVESNDYNFQPVFQDRDSVLNSDYVTDEKTTTIEINALPLPLLTRNGAQTAHAFESNDSKVFLVKYDGVYNGNNLAQPTTEYLIPAVHLRDWQKWFEFRIFAQAFSWGFKAWDEQLLKIKAKRKIFAYNRYHIIKNINKTETVPDQFMVEIETNTLK
ncbi:hypothetical protein [Flavobacterium taihuense]|uniref:Uncharacterized protein n=1 Tax=Flavobacterium taihuense TaxID=2857508 RepID=A0ABS6Y0P1_9FLAO|nr:hypothetical protein [Flavobacterium taihuense]MBW4362502.1 hypothetical protein [Flavobacterium taihuense]